MIEFVRNFMAGSWDRINLTLEDVKWTVGTIMVLTMIGILPPFFGTPIKHSFYLAFPIWIFSAYRLLSLYRYLHVAVAGEIVESLQAIGEKKNENIWDSPLAATYRKVAINIWLSQTIIFLAAPLYFNLTDSGRLWLPIIIMVIFVIAMMSLKAGLAIFRATAYITIIIFFLLAVHDMFPQVSMIPQVAEVSAKLRAGKMAGENARRLENLATKQEKQRQENFSRAIAEAEAWLDKNRGRELPADLQKKFEASKVGLTVSEYDAKVEAKAAEAEAKKAEAKAAAETKAASEAKVSAEAKAIAEAKSTKEATEKRAVSANPIKRLLCFKKLEDYVGINPNIKEGCNEIIDFNHVGGLIEFKIQTDNVNMNCLYTGQEVGERKFKGNWVQQGPGGRTGTWEMEFFPGFDYGVGVQRNDCDPTPIPSVVRKG